MIKKILTFFKTNVKELLIVFVLLFFSNDTLLFGTNANKSVFWLQFVALLFLMLFLVVKARCISTRSILILFSFSLLIILTSSINNDFSIKYPYEFIMIFISILVVEAVSFDRFKKAFCFWVEFFCAVAIFLFLLSFVAPGLINLFPTIINENGVRYQFVLFGLIEEPGYSVVPRVYGVFREPGVFMVFLLMALLFESLFSKTLPIKRVLLLAIGVLVTFSTAAYLLLLLTIVTILIKHLILNPDLKAKKKALSFLLLFLIGCCLFVGIIGFDRINNFVFNKLRVSNNSYDSRVGSIYGNIAMFTRNPIFGNGFTFFENNFSEYAYIRGFYEAHNTNTFLKILSVHGIVYFCIVLVGFAGLFAKNCHSVIIFLLSFFIILGIFSDEDLMVNTIVYVFVCYGLCKTKKQSLPLEQRYMVLKV